MFWQFPRKIGDYHRNPCSHCCYGKKIEHNILITQVPRKCSGIFGTNSVLQIAIYTAVYTNNVSSHSNMILKCHYNLVE